MKHPPVTCPGPPRRPLHRSAAHQRTSIRDQTVASGRPFTKRTACITPPQVQARKAGRRESAGWREFVMRLSKNYRPTFPRTHPRTRTRCTQRPQCHTSLANLNPHRRTRTGRARSHALPLSSLTCPRPSRSLGRGLAACASALAAHLRRRQLGRCRGALWRRDGRHLHLVWRGVRVRVWVGYRVWGLAWGLGGFS